METLNVGIVGAGGIARAHGIGWQRNAARARIVAAADVEPSRAQFLLDNYGTSNGEIYNSVEALLRDRNVDAVDICLPHHLHTGAIIAAARAGKAILCEKPLCTSLDDAAKIDAVLRETGATFVMAHNQLFQPSLIEARQMLAAGTLGRPFIFRSIECFQNRSALLGQQSHQLGPGESPWAWRADLQRMGGGEVLDTGWHASYRLLALANDRPVEVTAMTDRFLIPGLPAEDTGLLLVRFAGGAIGQLITSWAFAPIGGFHFEVMAEHGSIAGGATRLLHQPHGWPAPAERAIEQTHTFTAEIVHFLDVVQQGAQSQATFAQGARVLQLTKAAYLSAAEHRSVALPENPLEPGVLVGEEADREMSAVA
ncbi:MAG TPA: Gfo/Idh/MocA family oxidoreductase [Thermomicrobiales bacterium]|nr:Gfo/Idh/MocA family oxidoreductase [Thermomicrobiales bacterium]